MFLVSLTGYRLLPGKTQELGGPNVPKDLSRDISVLRVPRYLRYC